MYIYICAFRKSPMTLDDSFTQFVFDMANSPLYQLTANTPVINTMFIYYLFIKCTVSFSMIHSELCNK